MKWDLRFLRLAAEVATWSKDPSTHCGAVIARPDHTIVSLGYNGFPRRTPDREEDYADRDKKLSRVIHAEVNAILNAHGSVEGCTLYSYPPGHGPTCDRCAAHVIQVGIARVVGIAAPSSFATRWKESCEAAVAHYADAGVEVTMIPWEQFAYGIPYEEGSRPASETA